MRVVTLLPSATEIVYALGLEPVATSHECDWPAEAAEMPAVNRSRVDAGAPAGDIDAQVLDAEAEDGVYEIDLAALVRADPDIVVSQGICDVCAVDSVLVRDAVEELGLDCTVLTTDPHSLEDVFDDIERIGRATGREARAAAVVADLRERVSAVRSRTADLGPDERPRVAVLDWTDPVMTAGHWVPELVEWAGGEYGLGERGAASRPRRWAEIREYDPEALVVAPCGFDLEQTAANRSDLTDREGWSALGAVRDGRAWAMDGHHYLNRPGPRLVDSLEHLAGLFHPDRFDAPPADVARPLARAEAR